MLALLNGVVKNGILQAVSGAFSANALPIQRYEFFASMTDMEIEMNLMSLLMGY